jgi:asparagine synthase (glutamine-hydrolysing)
MCGFFFTNNAGRYKDQNGFEKLVNDRLYPRGPDSVGEYRGVSGEYGLFRRLAINGINSGDQPRRFGTKVLFFNGEIYNYRELNDNLGLNLSGEYGDAEFLEAALTRYQLEQLVSYLRGMFAIVVFDEANGSIFGARDHFGKKPLFFNCVDGFTVSSDSLLAGLDHDLKSSLSGQLLSYGLTNGLIPVGKSYFVGVEEIFPGHTFLFKNGKLTQNKIKMAKADHLQNTSFNDLVNSAVSTRLIGEREIGLLLSAGRDSMVVHGLAKQFSRLRTHTVHFKSVTGEKEKRFTDTSDFLLDHESFLEVTEKFLGLVDEPIIDPATIPIFALASDLDDQSSIILLSGDGADELDLGYAWYAKIRFILKLRRFWWLRYAFFPFLKIFQYSKIAQLLTAGSVYEAAARIRSICPISFSADLRQRKFFSISDAIIFDRQIFLPQTILKKLDRAGMMASKEIRSPFLDERLFNNDDKLCAAKLGKPRITQIFRSIYGKNPAKKQGFDLPLTEWIDDSVLDCIKMEASLLADILSVEKKDLLAFIEDWRTRRGFGVYFIWNLFTFVSWKHSHTRHIRSIV